MTKTQHKRTAVASMFQNGISRNTKCAERDGFCREGHILSFCWHFVSKNNKNLVAFKGITENWLIYSNRTHSCSTKGIWFWQIFWHVWFRQITRILKRIMKNNFELAFLISVPDMWSLLMCNRKLVWQNTLFYEFHVLLTTCEFFLAQVFRSSLHSLW